MNFLNQDPSPLSVQTRTIVALMVRDMMLRFGRNNIGFLWVAIEPILLTAGVLVLFSIAKSKYEHGAHVVSLVLTGYLPLTLWRHTTNSGIYMLRRAASILYHRKISLLDVFIARMGLEVLGTTLALGLVYGLLLMLDIVEPAKDVGLTLLAWFLMGALGSGVALLVAALTELSESAERFIQPIQYLLVPLSGVFFMVDWLPSSAQAFIWFNPLTHAIEMFRGGFFGESVETHFTYWYLIAWILGVWTVGLECLHRARLRFTGV